MRGRRCVLRVAYCVFTCVPVSVFTSVRVYLYTCVPVYLFTIVSARVPLSE